MVDTRLELFMENLKQLIYGHSNPLINNHPSILSQRPQFQLLYDELDFIFQTLFVDDLNDLEEVRNLKKRFKDAADEAEDTMDMFISSAILNDNESFLGEGRANVLDCCLNLKPVMEEIKSIKKEMVPTKGSINDNTIQQPVTKEMMQGASPQAAATSTSTNPARRNPGGTEHEEVIVGFDDGARSIMDRLVGDHKQLDIISIVGMGGLGKTTMATKVFYDPYILYYFQVRGWITVSQTYAKRDLLIEILKSIGKSAFQTTSEMDLKEMLYKGLKGKRYLIVIDDIWSAKAWQDLRLYLPDDNIGSRVLLTTRLAEVVLHARPGNFTHNLRYLTQEESWELLCIKVFRDGECPQSLIQIGKNIAERCQGLPLALVVIAGLLEKGEKSKHFWEKVAKSVGSYIVNDPEGCLDTLALSYDHLPIHLRNCFLYVGGFPEDYEINVRMLIRLWMAEGFIKAGGQKSLEEQGKAYLMDLVDRNLLIVAERKSDGQIKSCRLHDLLRELCLKKATEDNFFKKIGTSDSIHVYRMLTSSIDKQYRLFTDYKVLLEISSHYPTTCIRSILCFSYAYHGSKFTWVASFVLLRVLNIEYVSRVDLRDIQNLVHLRYLAVSSIKKEFPISMGNLCGLQTLIVRTPLHEVYTLDNMANMVNLRHLCSKAIIVIHPSFPVFSNLQMISGLRLDNGAEILLRSFPNIKKLGCHVPTTLENHAILNFAVLTHLETLKVEGEIPLYVAKSMTFPKTLKKLTLERCCLPWTYMSNIQRLPKLEVLKLLRSSFEGSHWNTGEQPFCQLKVLKLEWLNIQSWEAFGVNFPQLKKLVVMNCSSVKKIPGEIGDIFTLDSIEIYGENTSLLDFVNEIQEEQHAKGNYALNIIYSSYETSALNKRVEYFIARFNHEMQDQRYEMETGAG